MDPEGPDPARIGKGLCGKSLPSKTHCEQDPQMIKQDSCQIIARNRTFVDQRLRQARTEKMQKYHVVGDSIYSG